MNTRKSRPLLRVAALTASALLVGCGSAEGEPLPGNPKGSHFDDNASQTPDVLVSGTLVVEGPTPEATAIFVSLRGPSGPPLAAKKLPVGPFPMAFELTKADLIQMGGERPLPEQVSIKATFDADGNAMTAEPDMPKHEGSIAVGSKDVTLTLRAFIPLPGNPKGSMYDKGLEAPVAEPKLGE
ncbi:MAG: hypothetical protein R3F61_32645 [Myxococcota bacterium]